MTATTKKQGHLDGLCGIYAIVNALEEYGVTKADRVFEICCRALSPTRWPETLWQGTTFRDLEIMLKACRENLKIDTVQISYPFRNSQPATNQDFWQDFDELFSENRNNKCAILGLEVPEMHWLVTKPKAGALLFIDSDDIKPRRKVAREDIYAGGRRTAAQTYRINKKEVILFERTP